METAFEQQGKSITKTIAHIYTFQHRLPKDFMIANHAMTEKEKNHIICEMLLPF